METRRQRRERGLTTAQLLLKEAERLLGRAASVEHQQQWFEAESAAVENEGFEQLGRFETHRVALMKARERLNAAEIKGRTAEVPALRSVLQTLEVSQRAIWEVVEALWRRSCRLTERAGRCAEEARVLREEARTLLEQARLLSLPGEEGPPDGEQAR